MTEPLPSGSRKRRWRLWLCVIGGIPFAVWTLLFALFPAFGFGRVYKVPTRSMSPTLNPGELIYSSELAYRSNSPQRGDIVVMDTTGIPGLVGGQYYFCRVAGLPGDVVSVQNKRLILNGEPLFSRGDVPYETFDSHFPEFTLGETHKVPPVSYFLLGDNAPNSMDSRVYGSVPGQNIKGRVILRIWPLSGFGRL